MIVRKSIEDLSNEFQARHLDFFLESDFQARLYGLLREKLKEEDSLSVDVPQKWHAVEINDDRNKCSRYIDWLESRVDDQAKSRTGTHLTRVHTEVWVSEQFHYKNNNLLDLVVLTSGERPFRPIQWQNGKQRIEIESVDATIELKYIKNRSNLRKRINGTNPENATIDEISENLDLGFNDIQKDIRESERLASIYSNLDTYVVLFSNYDFLYRGNIAQQYLPNPSLNNKIGEAARIKIQNECEEANVFYSSPKYNEWLSNNL